MKGQRRQKILWATVDDGPVLHAFPYNTMVGKFSYATICGMTAQKRIPDTLVDRCSACHLALKRAY